MSDSDYYSNYYLEVKSKYASSFNSLTGF